MELINIATQVDSGNINGVLITIGGILIIGLFSIIWFMIKRYIKGQESVNSELSTTMKGVQSAVSEFRIIANEVKYAQKDIARVENDYKDHLNIFHIKK